MFEYWLCICEWPWYDLFQLGASPLVSLLSSFPHWRMSFPYGSSFSCWELFISMSTILSFRLILTGFLSLNWLSFWLFCRVFLLELPPLFNINVLLPVFAVWLFFWELGTGLGLQPFGPPPPLNENSSFLEAISRWFCLIAWELFREEQIDWSTLFFYFWLFKSGFASKWSFSTN